MRDLRKISILREISKILQTEVSSTFFYSLTSRFYRQKSWKYKFTGGSGKYRRKFFLQKMIWGTFGEFGNSAIFSLNIMGVGNDITI
jgi:hypothetical protein